MFGGDTSSSVEAAVQTRHLRAQSSVTTRREQRSGCSVTRPRPQFQLSAANSMPRWSARSSCRPNPVVRASDEFLSLDLKFHLELCTFNRFFG